jgi:hypothetical protein
VKDDILEFVGRGAAKSVNIDFERYTIFDIKENDPDRFKTLKRDWTIIQALILTQIATDDSHLDRWLDILVRGRFLFSQRKTDFKRPLHLLFDTLKDLDVSTAVAGIYKKLSELIDGLSTYETWGMGEIKLNIYKMLHISSNTGKSELKEDAKHFFFNKHQEDFITLPDHKEPTSKRLGRINFIDPKRKYDPIMDQIVDRQLFKHHMYLATNC